MHAGSRYHCLFLFHFLHVFEWYYQLLVDRVDNCVSNILHCLSSRNRFFLCCVCPYFACNSLQFWQNTDVSEQRANDENSTNVNATFIRNSTM